MSPNPRPDDTDEQSRHTFNALAHLLGRVTPWLLAVGSWIFGGLIAFNLLFISAILNARPVDLPIRISITTFVIALPLNVTGLLLLRLVQDMQEIRLDEITIQAFQETGFPDLDAYLPPLHEREKQNERRSRLSVGYSFAIAALTVMLTLTGFVAALWHVAWWIGVALVATVALCATLVMVIAGHSLSPESAAEKELKNRYLRYRMQQRAGSSEKDHGLTGAFPIMRRRHRAEAPASAEGAVLRRGHLS